MRECKSCGHRSQRGEFLYTGLDSTANIKRAKGNLMIKCEGGHEGKEVK